MPWKLFEKKSQPLIYFLRTTEDVLLDSSYSPAGKIEQSFNDDPHCFVCKEDKMYWSEEFPMIT